MTLKQAYHHLTINALNIKTTISCANGLRPSVSYLFFFVHLMLSSSFDKLELLTAKEEYSTAADELDDLYTNILLANHAKASTHSHKRKGEIKKDLHQLNQLYEIKKQECNRLYTQMIKLEEKYNKTHPDKNKHIEFVNTPIISGGSVDAIWRRQHRICLYGGSPSVVRSEVLDNWESEEEQTRELTRDDFDTDWEYKTYLALRT